MEAGLLSRISYLHWDGGMQGSGGGAGVSGDDSGE
jgi:hypothetical protein